MAYPKGSANTEFDFTDIQKSLTIQLERSRQQSPDSFSKKIYVLPAVCDEIEGQLEQQLQQEREDHQEKRILLIPYCLENSHWIGVLIEFQAADRISRAEYLDPVSEHNVVSDRLRKQLAKVYPSAILQLRDRFKHTERRFSSVLTIKNLLAAVENDQRSNSSHPEAQSSNWLNSQTNIQPRTTTVGNEGNDYILAEKQQELSIGLEKFQIRSIDTLPQKIQETEELIREYEEEKRLDNVKKETAILKELRQLQNLANEIGILIQAPPISDDYMQLKLRRMKEELSNELAKLTIRDVDMLLQRIQRTENRIRKYEEEKRTDDAKEQIIHLKDLQRVQNLADEIVRLSQVPPPPESNAHLKLRQMKEELVIGLEKLSIQDEAMLLQKIQQTEVLISEYEEEESMYNAEKETVYLKELRRLQTLANKINETFVLPAIDIVEPISDRSLPSTPQLTGSNTIRLDDRRKKLFYTKDLSAEADIMPTCARKTVLELLVHFEEKLSGENTSSQSHETVMSSLQKLKDQVKREELLSDDIKTVLRNLETHVTNLTNESYSDIVRYLNELLKRFRSLNVSEIQRLVGKAAEAAELIENKDVVLLIGATGAGKSTTIQFLAGAQMEEVQVEVSPGRFLEHVTAVAPFKNPDLKNVNSSPLQRSETRYIAPVTVELKDVLGPQESGTITLCDAPGFGDTAGPEVDIANSIGVIEALNRANSVKLLALLSLKGLGDRGEGVQKLAHILISMIHKIEDKLDGIVYAFTGYPESTDIHALLLQTKKSKIDTDAILKSDTAFERVLVDMMEKTEDGAFKIQPTRDNPKKLMRKLKSVRGIKNPAEVFRFSMSEETRASISDHVQRDKFSIICAQKHKHNDLVLYYLNDLQILKGLMKESFIRDAYEESVRFVSESINNYCTEMKEKFNRVLNSQDGLEKKDILDYLTSMKYLEHAQILKEHLGSSLSSPASMLQNIISELNEISRTLNEDELHSPLVTIYLRNLCELKNSFVELRDCYHSSCTIFQKRFNELVQTADELIPKNDFKEIAEIFLTVFQSARVLKNHSHERVQEAYNDLIKSLLRHLNSYSEKAEQFLAKVRLSPEEVKTISDYMEILRSAKDNAALQERVSRYLEALKKKPENTDNYDYFGEKTQDLKRIYDEFIEKVVNNFYDINLRIKELFEKSGDYALENIKTLVDDMKALRTIPELELKTAGTYYHTVENIRGYMQQLQADAEKLLIAIDQQTGVTNYKYLARSLARLKNAEWINQVSPGTYDNLMLRITEELSQYAFQLETILLKIDLSLKCPETVLTAAAVVEKIESMRDLERSVPELEKYRKNIVEQFVKCTQVVFDRIQKTFDLEDKDVYQIKQKLKELEEIKQQYDSLHPARKFLQNQGYADINMLNNEIEELAAKQRTERNAMEVVECEKKAELSKLNTIIRQYMNIAYTPTSVMDTLSSMVGSGHQNKNAGADNYLQKLGYARIEVVYDQISKIEKNHQNKIQRFQDENTECSVSLHRLESLKKEHDSLLTSRHLSPEEVTFLREKGFNSYESFDETIQEKTKVISERGKNKQAYHFTDRLDASTANSAIVYLIQCEKVGHLSVRENAIDAHENLRKYIREYGVFLKQETNKKFIHTRNIGSEGGPFMYSQDLEMRLHELSSFSKYPYVFDCIQGVETTEQWHQEFLDSHRSLSGKMEEYKVPGKIRELKDQVVIAQALTCVDRFCAVIFAGNGFGA